MHLYKFVIMRVGALVCLIIPSALIAQDYRQGYIIRNNMDSVSGYLEYATEKKNTTYCSFRTAKRSKATRLTPEELRAYGFYGDKQYISMNIPNQPAGKVFVKVLARGPMQLYQYKKEFIAGKDSLVVLPLPKEEFIDTPKGKRAREDSRYKGLLNFLLSDCKLSANETKYTEYDLTNLVNNYNRCKGVEPIFKKPRPVFRANYFAFGGYVSSDMTVDYSQPIQFNTSKTVVGGLGFEISSPRLFDRIFLAVDFSYVNNLYQAYYTTKSSSDITHNDIQMEFTSLKIPFGFRYNFLKDINTPYIKGGIVVSKVIDHKFETIQEVQYSDGRVSTSQSEEEYAMQKSPKGFWFAVGYTKRITGNLQLFGEFRYDKGEGFIGTPIQKFSDLKNLSFMLGIRF